MSGLSRLSLAEGYEPDWPPFPPQPPPLRIPRANDEFTRPNVPSNPALSKRGPPPSSAATHSLSYESPKLHPTFT